MAERSALGRWLVLVAVPGLVLPLAQRAGAEEPSPAAAAELRVEVVLVGDFGSDPALGALLAEWIEGSGFVPVVTRSERLTAADLRAFGAESAPIRLWLAPAGANRVRVVFAEPRTGRLLVRELPVPVGLDELGRERVAQVVLSSALAFRAGEASSSEAEVERALADGRAQPPPTPTPPPRPRSSPVVTAPAPSPRRQPSWRYEIGARFAVEERGSAGWRQNRARGRPGSR